MLHKDTKVLPEEVMTDYFTHEFLNISTQDSLTVLSDLDSSTPLSTTTMSTSTVSNTSSIESTAYSLDSSRKNSLNITQQVVIICPPPSYLISMFTGYEFSIGILLGLSIYIIIAVCSKPVLRLMNSRVTSNSSLSLSPTRSSKQYNKGTFHPADLPVAESSLV